jgi:hypothetical protein
MTAPIHDHYCLSARRCADIVDGHPRETAGPRAFCDGCVDRTTRRVARLPEQYLRLHHMLGERHTGIDAGIRRPRPGSMIPLNVHVDTLLGDILETSTLAAEVLADAMGMDNPDHHPAERQVAACAAIIAPNVTRLAYASGVGGRPGHDLGIDVMTWVGSVRAATTTTGAEIVIRLDGLASLAHFTLGLTRARSQRDLPCTRCAAKTVGRFAGSDDFDCTTCGSRFPEDDIRRQDRILLALAKKGLIATP